MSWLLRHKHNRFISSLMFVINHQFDWQIILHDSLEAKQMHSLKKIQKIKNHSLTSRKSIKCIYHWPFPISAIFVWSCLMLGDIRWSKGQSKEKNVHTVGLMNTVKSIQPFFISDVSYQREYSMLLLLRKKNTLWCHYSVAINCIKILSIALILMVKATIIFLN